MTNLSYCETFHPHAKCPVVHGIPIEITGFHLQKNHRTLVNVTTTKLKIHYKLSQKKKKASILVYLFLLSTFFYFSYIT